MEQAESTSDQQSTPRIFYIDTTRCLPTCPLICDSGCFHHPLDPPLIQRTFHLIELKVTVLNTSINRVAARRQFEMSCATILPALALFVIKSAFGQSTTAPSIATNATKPLNVIVLLAEEDPAFVPVLNYAQFLVHEQKLLSDKYQLV